VRSSDSEVEDVNNLMTETRTLEEFGRALFSEINELRVEKVVVWESAVIFRVGENCIFPNMAGQILQFPRVFFLGVLRVQDIHGLQVNINS
jgi:hypothetical protein